MRLIKNTTELIGIKDQNIIISLVFETDTHIEIQAKLDYPAPSCPHCHGKMIKYDFQKNSKIPLLEQAGTPTLLCLKKRRFQCKSCKRVTVAETSIVEKNHHERMHTLYVVPDLCQFFVQSIEWILFEPDPVEQLTLILLQISISL